MSITVGLDFGTHQTKICVEDSTDSLNKTYRFITFIDNDGNDTLFLPSIVQINDDDTVNYGFVDESRCKIVEGAVTPKPKLSDYVDGNIVIPQLAPKRPAAEYPIMPTPPTILKKPVPPQKRCPLLTSPTEWKAQYKQLQKKYIADVTRYKHNNKFQAANIEKYKVEKRQWQKACEIIDSERLVYQHYIDKVTTVNNQTKQYKSALEEWEESQKPKRASFRYFKIPTLLNIVDGWEHNISYNYTSIWYIANILFLLNEMYGNEYTVQIGIPVTYSESGKYRNNAYRLLLSAFDLVENKFESKDDFISATYLELMDLTVLKPLCDDDIVTTYGIAAIPEAYASLRAVTSRGGLGGMQFLVDIGGGTTDIAFFTVADFMPDIHKIESMPIGLNFILEQYSRDNAVSIELAQEKFSISDDGFYDYILMYKSLLKQYLQGLITQIIKEYIKVNPKHVKSLYKAFEGKNIIYCGGGGVNQSLYVDFDKYFNDLRLLDVNMLDADRVINNIEDELYPIISTAYGLSIELEGRDKDVIHLTPFSNTFDKVKIHANDSVSERNDDM